MSKYIRPSNGVAMRASWMAVISIFFLASLPPRVAADDVVFKGSKSDAAKKVRNELMQLSTKSDEYKKEDTRGGEKFDSYVKGLGFESVNDLPNAMVGKPVPIYSVHLDKLRDIEKEEDIDPWSLLTETDGAIVPISVQQKVRSSATVSVAPSEHLRKPPVKVDVLGSRNDTKLLREIETRPCKCFVIRANALDRQFLGEGDKTEKSFKVRVIADGPGKLKKGDLLDAKDVFAELSREAKKPRYVMPDRP